MNKELNEIYIELAQAKELFGTYYNNSVIA